MAKAIEAKKTTPAKAEKSTKEKKPSLPLGKKYGTLALKTRQRLEKAMKKVAASDAAELADIKAALANAVTSLDSMAIKFTALPDSFTLKAGKSAGGSSKIEIGSTVAIKAKRLPEYEGLLVEADLASLSVIAVKDSKLVLKTGSGNKIIMPKAHVEVVKAAATEAKAA